MSLRFSETYDPKIDYYSDKEYRLIYDLNRSKNGMFLEKILQNLGEEKILILFDRGLIPTRSLLSQITSLYLSGNFMNDEFIYIVMDYRPKNSTVDPVKLMSIYQKVELAAISGSIANYRNNRIPVPRPIAQSLGRAVNLSALITNYKNARADEMGMIDMDVIRDVGYSQEIEGLVEEYEGESCVIS